MDFISEDLCNIILTKSSASLIIDRSSHDIRSSLISYEFSDYFVALQLHVHYLRNDNKSLHVRFACTSGIKRHGLIFSVQFTVR